MRQPLIEIAHQRACRTNIEDAQPLCFFAAKLVLVESVTFEQRGQRRFCFTCRRGRDDQRVVTLEDRGQRLLLNRRKVAVARKKDRPGMRELLLKLVCGVHVAVTDTENLCSKASHPVGSRMPA